MKILKFKQFVNESFALNESINEAAMKIPARIKSKEDIEKYFWGYDAKQAESLWGKSNSTMILQAANGKHYWVKFVQKNWPHGPKYLHLSKAKEHPTKKGKFTM